jgi:hypothetical protein
MAYIFVKKQSSGLKFPGIGVFIKYLYPRLILYILLIPAKLPLLLKRE